MLTVNNKKPTTLRKDDYIVFNEDKGSISFHRPIGIPLQVRGEDKITMAINKLDFVNVAKLIGNLYDLSIIKIELMGNSSVGFKFI